MAVGAAVEGAVGVTTHSQALDTAAALPQFDTKVGTLDIKVVVYVGQTADAETVCWIT